MRSLVERIDQLNDASLDRKWMGASSAIGLLIHELQRERGLSSGFIASNGEHFADQLGAQQKQTDASLASLTSIVREQALDKTVRQRLDAGALQLPKLRLRVRQLEISRDYTVDRYTGIIDTLFDLQLSTFGNASEPSIFRKQMAFIAFAQAKEMSGQERALLSAMLSDRNFSAGRMVMLNSIKAAEAARLANFVRLADQDALAAYQNILKQAYIKDAERIRQKVQAAAWREALGDEGTAVLPSPDAWFALASAKIDAMKQLEDALNASVNADAQQMEGRAQQELLISGFLALLSFALAGILIHQIQRGGRVAEHQLNLAEAVFSNSVESILVTDADLRIIEVNPAFLRISGYTRDEIIGQHPRILKSGRHDAAFFEKVWNEVNASGTWVGEVWNRRKNGEIYPALLSIAAVTGSDGVVSNYTGMIFDLSRHKTVEALLNQLRTFDGLTALPNRESWLSALEQMLVNAQRSSSRFSILAVDLDRLKVINDSLGYAVGDLVLIEAAERIKNTLRKYDIVARLVGNRFAVLLNEIAEPQDIGSVCEKLLTAFARPFELDGINVHVTASIGAAIYPTDGSDSNTLMMAAESALYSAKADGRNLYKYYSREMNEMGSLLFKLERMLRFALERNEFSVVYQPQVNAQSGCLVGVEALLRWNNPELGNVSPVQFIPIAEETGLIVAIGEWIMRAACQQVCQWQRELGIEIPVAVNLSARQFRRNDLLASVQTVLDETGLPSRLLELEITEGLLMTDPIGAIAIMQGLNAMGIKTALDDFGTGYSSLAYLKTFPLNRLKIDRAFVRDLPNNRSDCAITNTIIALGLNLNMQVLAEGVETEAQREFLTNSGCQVFQGYLFGKPMPGEELTLRLTSGELVVAAV
ncbi:EAL domain-containing protein [Dechloromonas denitrificans]|uniref:EAL domain-containing protein n=1 Tax=Dechloromonas denitrificans TaxID=281362 RepID=UPI001CF9ED10|nr:EAL domain-containing protein [Dechloromonas denitrificans]UCV06752.1 EAL domain-containing protein [Dechloromonas denitrificans]